MRETFGPVKGNRLPAVAKPGAKKSELPVAQQGGGGNKGTRTAPVVTAATAPMVSVSPTGAVTTEHFGPSPQQKARAAKARVAEQQSKRRVQRVRKVVRSLDAEPAPKRELKVSADFLKKAESPKPVTVAAHTRALPGARKPSVPVAKHQRALPQPKPPQLKGTPKQRQAVRADLKAAKKEVLHSKPQLEGNFGPAQKQFIQQTAKASGLSPKTIAVQAIAEEGAGPGSPAAGYEAEGNNNFLNLGPGEKFSTPQEGAQATAANFKGPVYANVEAQKGKGAKAQLAAIEASPWDGDAHYEGNLQKILGEDQVKTTPGNPQALQHYKQAATKAKKLGMKVGPALPDVQADPASHTIKVKATAKGAVEWAEAQINVQENSGKQLKWAANFGLEAGGPWCANMVSNNLARRGFTTSTLPANPNYTPSYEEWGAAGVHAKDIGTNLADAKPGDILTFSGDHTAMYAGNGEMISGNFSNEVMKTPVSEGPAPLSMIIRPKYKGGFVTVKESTPLPGTTSATGTLTGSAAPAAVSVVSSTNTAPTDPKNGKPVAGKTLTAMQQIRQNVDKLKRLGVEVAAPGEETKAEAANKPGDSSLHQQLAALEKRYSIGAV